MMASTSLTIHCSSAPLLPARNETQRRLRGSYGRPGGHGSCWGSGSRLRIRPRSLMHPRWASQTLFMMHRLREPPSATPRSPPSFTPRMRFSSRCCAGDCCRACGQPHIVRMGIDHHPPRLVLGRLPYRRLFGLPIRCVLRPSGGSAASPTTWRPCSSSCLCTHSSVPIRQ